MIETGDVQDNLRGDIPILLWNPPFLQTVWTAYTTIKNSFATDRRIGDDDDDDEPFHYPVITTKIAWADSPLFARSSSAPSAQRDAIPKWPSAVLTVA